MRQADHNLLAELGHWGFLTQRGYGWNWWMMVKWFYSALQMLIWEIGRFLICGNSMAESCLICTEWITVVLTNVRWLRSRKVLVNQIVKQFINNVFMVKYGKAKVHLSNQWQQTAARFSMYSCDLQATMSYNDHQEASQSWANIIAKVVGMKCFQYETRPWPLS